MQDKSDTSATRTTRIQYESDTSDTSETRVRQKCDTSTTQTTRVKNFDKLTTTLVKTYFYTLISTLLYGERKTTSRGTISFHSKNYLLEIPRFHAKMRLKSASQKLNFLMGKAVSKRCILDCSCKCPCTFPHSYEQ